MKQPSTRHIQAREHYFAPVMCKAGGVVYYYLLISKYLFRCYPLFTHCGRLYMVKGVLGGLFSFNIPFIRGNLNNNGAPRCIEGDTAIIRA